MPHVKTFARVAKESDDLAWVIVGSHNLSGAAWGEFILFRLYRQLV